MKKKTALIAAAVICLWTSGLCSCSNDEQQRSDRPAMAVTDNYVEETSPSKSLDHAKPIPEDTGTLTLTEQQFADQRLRLKLPEGVTAEAQGDNVVVTDDAGSWVITVRQRKTFDWAREYDNIYSGSHEGWLKNPDADECDVSFAGFPAKMTARNEDRVSLNGEFHDCARIDIVADYGSKAVGQWNGLWATLEPKEPAESDNIYNMLFLRHVRAVLNGIHVDEGDEGKTCDTNGLKITYPSRWDVREDLCGSYAEIRDGSRSGTFYVTTTDEDYDKITGEMKTFGNITYKCYPEEIYRGENASDQKMVMYGNFGGGRCFKGELVLRGCVSEDLKEMFSSAEFSDIMQSVEFKPDEFSLNGSHADTNGFVCTDNGLLTDYKGSDPEPVTPEEIDGIKIVELKSGLFKKSSITSAVIKGEVRVGSGCFEGAKNLKSVKFGEGVTTVGAECFKDCKSLESVSFSKTVNYLGENMFEGCTSLGSLTIPDGCEMSSYLFNSVGKGTLTIGKNVQLDDYALYLSGFDSIETDSGCDFSADNIFDSCRSKVITIGEGAQQFGDYCFAYTEKISQLSLPATSRILGTGCFAESGIKGIELPEGISVIPEYCFDGALSAFVVVPGSVTNINANAFNSAAVYLKNSDIVLANSAISCNYLYLGGVYDRAAAPGNIENQKVYAQIYLPMDATARETADFDEFIASKGMEEITWVQASLPYLDINYGNFKTDDVYLSAYSGKSTDMYIPPLSGNYGVIRRIRSGAFKNSQLTSVVIPGSVNKIESGAFSGSESLKDIWFSGIITDYLGEDNLEKNALSGLPEDVTVHLSARLSGEEQETVKKALIKAGLPSSAAFETYEIK